MREKVLMGSSGVFLSPDVCLDIQSPPEPTRGGRDWSSLTCLTIRADIRLAKAMTGPGT